MEGEMVNPPEEIYPDYYKYWIYIYSHRNKCMYAESNKSIYGTIEASLLFWGKLFKIL